MPKAYKTKNELKLAILSTARIFFKEYGYTNTTFQMIADELHISTASISMHFKAKSLIVFKLCEIFINHVYLFIQENIEDGFNYYEYYCVAHIVIYREILKSKQYTDLFFHKAHIAVWEDERIYVVEDYYREITNDFKKDLTEKEINAIAMMNVGAKLSLIKKYTKNPGYLSIDDCCRYMLYMVGAFSKLDEATVEKNISRAFSFVDGRAVIETPTFDSSFIAFSFPQKAPDKQPAKPPS